MTFIMHVSALLFLYLRVLVFVRENFGGKADVSWVCVYIASLCRKLSWMLDCLLCGCFANWFKSIGLRFSFILFLSIFVFVYKTVMCLLLYRYPIYLCIRMVRECLKYMLKNAKFPVFCTKIIFFANHSSVFLRFDFKKMPKSFFFGNHSFVSLKST